MKKCTKCGECKPISEFHKQKNGKYGVKSQCKDCIKKYYKNNKDVLRESYKEYYKNNKKYINERCAEYYKNNKEKILEYKQNYNIDVNKYKRKLIRSSLYHHKQKGYVVIVTIDDCVDMETEYCYYCGCKLEWEYGTGHSNYSPTIDRINNENTLTKDNIVFACIACNSGKHNGTIEEYIERCKRVVANENNILGDN